MNFDSVTCPKQITPCPIVEAVVELRFESMFPSETIQGIVYQSLHTEYSNIEPLPIMELPQSIRENDKNLKFNPHFRLKNNDFLVQVGPRCISIVSQKDYKGWEKYFSQIKKVFDQIKDVGIVQKPIRVGLRYISFFENTDIFENIDIQLSVGGNSLIGEQNILRSEFDIGMFRCILQIANRAEVTGNSAEGSICDIDITSDKNPHDFLSHFNDIVKNAHDLEKKIFFGILKESFLKKFNPEY